MSDPSLGRLCVGALTSRLCVARASTTGRPGRHGSYRYGSTVYIGRRRRSCDHDHDHDHSAPGNYYGDADDHPDRYDDDYGTTVHLSLIHI